MTAQTATVSARAVPSATRRASWLPQPLRKAILVVHVAASVGWLGLSLGLLTLAATAVTTSDPALLRGSYLAAGRFGEVLFAPVSLTAFTTGVVLALGTKWGLVRHWWVLAKFVLTLVPVILTFLSLRPSLAMVAEAASTMTDAALAGFANSADAINLVVAPSVASTMYLTSTILSVVKPWGRTPWSRQPRRATTKG